jgi:hypothetical protein
MSRQVPSGFSRVLGDVGSTQNRYTAAILGARGLITRSTLAFRSDVTTLVKHLPISF